MPGLIEASATSAWNYGGAILTFVFPMVLFLTVAGALYVIYTKPGVVPGRDRAVPRPIGATPVPGPPARAGDGGAVPWPAAVTVARQETAAAEPAVQPGAGNLPEGRQEAAGGQAPAGHAGSALGSADGVQ